jgi:hypothetical protein
MEGDFVLDIQEVLDNVESADVMSLFFPSLRKALVVDMRINDQVGPFVKVLPMVSSPQERIRSIQRLRPALPRPRNLTVIPWPRYVNSLVDLGVWERIVGRFHGSSNGSDGAGELNGVLDELKRLEKAELAAVVMGEGYHTIWP